MARTALHVSPHPDDEVLGCGATLLALRSAGWRVVNLACGLGRPPDHERRRSEMEAALTVLGIEGIVAHPAVALGADDDLDLAEVSVARHVGRALAATGAELILAPHPDEAHHGHAVVGRAVARLGRGGAPNLASATRWWAWGLWRDLTAPNRYVPYGSAALEQLTAALRCHAGEVGRNGYVDLLGARGRAQAVLGSERMLGFGAGPASPEPYADLLEERVGSASGWHLAGGHVVGLGELVDPDPDRRNGGPDALVDGVGDGP